MHNPCFGAEKKTNPKTSIIDDFIFHKKIMKGLIILMEYLHIISFDCLLVLFP